MASQRKRKYGSIAEPNEDILNASLKSLNDSAEQGTSTTEDEDNSMNYDRDSVVFYDCVHGHFQLPKVLLKIIDTPQFQRLRNISQMGGASYVFPNANHTRFQHCLGTAYLAGKLCTSLQQRQPQLEISSKDVLCVQIAGLCHDIGYGPFSKLFDKSFLPCVHPNSKWTHEDGSIDLFDHMWKMNDLDSVFENFLTDIDVEFIKEMIQGEPLGKQGHSTSQTWLFKGRPASKGFLYQIVSNKITGVDVDKFDYLARDSYHLGVPSTFDHNRFIEFARAIKCNGFFHICTRDKDARLMYEMFHMRVFLKQRGVSHKAVRAVKLMLNDVLVKASHLQVPTGLGQTCMMKNCTNNMDAFTKLTDGIVSVIGMSSDEKLLDSQKILKRLQKRDLYKLVVEKVLSPALCKSDRELREEFSGMMNMVTNRENYSFVIEHYDHGMGESNPLDNMCFYSKENPDVGFQLRRENISHLLPHVYSERHIRLYSKVDDHFLNKSMSSAFEEWYESIMSEDHYNSAEQSNISRER